MTIKAHWQYLKYVARHKWFVFLAGRRFRVSLWQLIIHDWSKFTPAEWTPYVRSFYGPWKYDERPPDVVEAFDRAWLHHIHKNPHHWQHWILREDDGDTKLLEMPDRFVREMLADWQGAGRAITGKDNLTDWYLENRRKIQLNSRARAELETLMAMYDYLPLKRYG